MTLKQLRVVFSSRNVAFVLISMMYTLHEYLPQNI